MGLIFKKLLMRADVGWVTPTDIPAAEAAALKWLYDNTAGNNWTNNTNWGVTYTANDWYGITVAGGHVTKIDLNANNLVGNIGAWAIDDLDSMATCYLYNNASISGDVSGWTLFALLVDLRIHNVSVSGDISGWTLPASMVYFYINGTLVSGDVSGWILPASLAHFRIDSTSVSGDISGWTLPASLVNFHINGTSVSGDISGWTLPASIVQFYTSSTLISGDISSWTLPASLVNFRVNNTSVSKSPALTSAIALGFYLYQDCGLSQADVDAVCLAVYNRRASFTDATPNLNVGGTNSVPSGVYQDGDPPTTGLEYVYEIANDPEIEGFNTWAVTYTGGSAP